MSLPLVRQGSSSDSKKKGAPPPAVVPAQAEQTDERLHVLLVDDEEDVRAVVKTMLEQQGHQVTTCVDGQQAVERYREIWSKVDVVILDVVMPVMDGRQAFAELRKINPDVIGLLASGYSRDGVAQDLLDAGMWGFIQKPFRKEELLRKLRSVRGSADR